VNESRKMRCTGHTVSMRGKPEMKRPTASKWQDNIKVNVRKTVVRRRFRWLNMMEDMTSVTNTEVP
jgi:hypothetical protein